jgi:hypothetical protein
MIHDVGGRSVTTGVAEPFGENQALDYQSRGVDTTVFNWLKS